MIPWVAHLCGDITSPPVPALLFITTITAVLRQKYHPQHSQQPVTCTPSHFHQKGMHCSDWHLNIHSLQSPLGKCGAIPPLLEFPVSTRSQFSSSLLSAQSGSPSHRQVAKMQ